MKKVKVLFFLTNGELTAADRQNADTVRKSINDAEVQVCYRNAHAAHDDGAPEPTDYVAGDVPDKYGHFPRIGNDGLVTASAGAQAEQSEVSAPFGGSAPQSPEAGTIASEVGSVGSWNANPFNKA